MLQILGAFVAVAINLWRRCRPL